MMLHSYRYLIALLVQNVNYFGFSTHRNITAILAPRENNFSSSVDILFELEYLLKMTQFHQQKSINLLYLTDAAQEGASR
jgi:hypothetical protein